MRRTWIGGFALIGGASTVAWAVSLLSSRHHAWQWLSVGLGCFLLAALYELYGRDRKRKKLLVTLNHLKREAMQGFAEESTFERFGDHAIRQVAEMSQTFGTQLEGELAEAQGWELTARVAHLRASLHDITRAVMTPGSYLD